MHYTTNELYHHGIKGQKWGVRRYQNPDGTLTEEGKRRYAKNPAYQYRDKRGNLTEQGKLYEKTDGERLRLTYGDYALNDDTHNDMLNREEQRVKSLFDNSSNPELRKPETQKKILEAWNHAVFVAHDREYNELPAKITKKANSLEKKLYDQEDKIRELRRQRQRKEITWEEFENHPAVKKHDAIYDQYYDELEKIGGVVRMRTMNDILRQVTPEMRDAVYGMMSAYWMYG